MPYDPHKLAYGPKDPIETKFNPATAKQENYIQILANDLGYTENQRDLLIGQTIKKQFHWIDDKLSKESASAVIAQFKAWKENR